MKTAQECIKYFEDNDFNPDYYVSGRSWSDEFRNVLEMFECEETPKYDGNTYYYFLTNKEYGYTVACSGWYSSWDSGDLNEKWFEVTRKKVEVYKYFDDRGNECVPSN